MNESSRETGLRPSDGIPFISTIMESKNIHFAPLHKLPSATGTTDILDLFLLQGFQLTLCLTKAHSSFLIFERLFASFQALPAVFYLISIQTNAQTREPIKI